MFHGIKPVYNRSTKSYTVEYTKGQPGDAIAMMNSGFYVCDNLAATLGLITAGKSTWYAGLKTGQQQAVKDWLMANV